MLGFLRKESREVLEKVSAQPGQPQTVRIGGENHPVVLRKISAAEELAVAGFIRQTVMVYTEMTGAPDPRVQLEVAAEAGVRAFAFYAVRKPGGDEPFFASLEDTRRLSFEEGAALSRLYDQVLGVTPEELKN